MLIKLENGKPTLTRITEKNFRALFPSTSFPATLTSDVVENLGYGLFEFSTIPDAGKHQKVIEVDAICDKNKIWRQTFELAEMSDKEKAESDADKEIKTRLARNYLLMNCDWTQLPDSPADHEAWATYRQELRDVTAQEGFPWDVTWPEAP